MEDKLYSDVASFLIRFVQDQTKANDSTRFHFVVRHVQTDNEKVLTCWEEVETFIQQVIPLNSTRKDQRRKP